ncbi:hypothetical protein IFM89_009975 [Coptis chinensis]|uniref:Myb/SANT-like domain-containing protein n=1 Tax=Coptis chinensis TaxID=261450 RepID=A0A835HJ05_9MAGN|nr:hypothetical protein IFM89_009975 [Coptis chinensis]
MANNVDNATEGNTEGSTESSAAKVHHVFTNVPGLAQAFLDLCVEEVTKEGYQGSSLKPISWKRVKDILNDKFKLNLEQKAFKNRWDAQKKKYVAWRNCVGKSGGGINFALGSINWPEEVWADVLQASPDVEVTDSYWDNITHQYSSVSAQPSTPHFEQGGTSSVASDGSKKKRKKVVDEEESDGVQELIGVVKNLVTHMEFERIEVKKNMESYSMSICMGFLLGLVKNVADGCDISTKHVTKIDLRNPHPFDGDHYDQHTGYDATYSKACLKGKELNSWLLRLKYLKYLDLSWNNFSRSRIPEFLGSFHELRYLNLSSAWFNDSLHWISHLYSLQYLGMNSINLSQASDWHHNINGLPSLSELYLSECRLARISPTSFHFNLTYLSVLDLSSNSFEGQIPNPLHNTTSLESLDLSGNHFVAPIPSWLGNFHRLVHLNLASNHFTGSIPIFLGNSSQVIGPDWSGQLKNLKYLDLSGNSFSGPIPNSLWSLSSLRELDLGENQLNGSIPETIGQLSELRSLFLGYNSLNGCITEDHFTKLSKLDYLQLGLNSLVMEVGSHWVPPFQLKYLYMTSTKVGPKFPAWLRTQSELIGLDIANTSISDSIPDWFGNQTSNLTFLDLQIESNSWSSA